MVKGRKKVKTDLHQNNDLEKVKESHPTIGLTLVRKAVAGWGGRGGSGHCLDTGHSGEGWGC